MPLAHLIFFEEPRELTEAQIEEARAGGLLREPSRPDAESVRYPVTRVPEQDPKPAERDKNNPVTGGQPSAPVPAAQPPSTPADTDAKPKEPTK